MVKVIIYTENESLIRGIEVSGHAGYGVKGQDIVCAGASALTYTLINSMEVLLDIHTECELTDGYTKYFLPKDIEGEKFEQSQLVFKTIIVGFNNMRDSYSSYIEVIEKEV